MPTRHRSAPEARAEGVSPGTDALLNPGSGVSRQGNRAAAGVRIRLPYRRPNPPGLSEARDYGVSSAAMTLRISPSLKAAL